MASRRLVALVMCSALACVFPTQGSRAEHAVGPTEEPPKNAEVVAKYDSRWMPYLALGAQFLPDYDENGRSSGLNKQQFFGLVTVDGSFGSDAKTSTWRNPLSGHFHTGITLALLGSPVKRADKPSLPKEFNDVANSIVSTGYLYVPMKQSENRIHNIGPLLRLGVISRESLGEEGSGSSDGDSVNWFYSVGAQYTFERFRLATKNDSPDGKHPLNGVPGGYFRLSAARFEDYAGLGRRTRLLGDAALQVYSKMNMYLGVQGNFGRGPDEFMVVVSMVRQPEEIAKLFNLGKDESE